MPIGLIIAIASAALVVTAIVVLFLNRAKLKEIIQKRKEKKQKQKVAFGKTSKVVGQNCKEMINSNSSISMDDLEKLQEDDSYFVVNYDPATDEIDDFATIEAKETEDKVDNLIKDKGIVVFD